MTKQTSGIHHITAIVGHPQENIDFYAGVLGLRLVKQTVNFDDPGTYQMSCMSFLMKLPASMGLSGAISLP